MERAWTCPDTAGLQIPTAPWAWLHHLPTAYAYQQPKVFLLSHLSCLFIQSTKTTHVHKTLLVTPTEFRLPVFFPAPPWMSQLSVSHCFLTLRSSYLANIFLVGHKVMESEVHHVRARYNSQSLKQKGAVRVIQIKNFSELLALQNKQNRSGQGKNEANCTWKKVNRTQCKHWPKSTASFLAFAKLFNAIFLVFPYFSFLFWSLHYLHPSRNNTLRPTSLHKHAVLV